MAYVDAFFDRDSDIIRCVERKDGKREYREYQAKYTFYDLGYNLRPTEITGFLGLEQLKYLEENIAIFEGFSFGSKGGILSAIG